MVWFKARGIKTRRQTIDFGKKKLSVTTIGNQTKSLVLPIISKGCPLTLPAGSYRLSGVLNNTVGNTVSLHRYWGIRLYDECGNGIAGRTYSGNQVNYENRETIWDIGGGAEFTLEKETRVTMNLYLTANKSILGFKVIPMLYKIG